MSGDLISREAVWKLLNMEHPWGFNNDDIAEAFRNAPAVDAEPVRHGRWVSNGMPESMLNGCSLCGFPCGAYSYYYCPNCGAKMDKEAKNETIPSQDP